MGLYEALFMNDEIKQLISLGKDSMTIQKAAVEGGMVTLRQAAVNRVVEGVTTVDEAFRATAK